MGLQGPTAVAFLYLDTHIVVWKQFFHLLGPFREAVFAAIEILFIADIVGLSDILKSIEVKVVHWVSRSRLIGIHDSKRGTAYIVFDSKADAKLLNQGSLSYPHLAKKGEEAFVLKCLYQFACHIGQYCNIVKYSFHDLYYLSLSAALTLASSRLMARCANKNITTLTHGTQVAME